MHEPTDPVTRYARDLAALMSSTRDLLEDSAYEVMLPHLEALAAVIPDPRLAPQPARLRLVPEPTPDLHDPFA